MLNKFLVKNPLITEKATRIGALNQYVFLVKKEATKSEIKKIVERAYKVKVSGVNVINIKPKTRRLGRSVGTKSGYKKAVITLKDGHKLDILPQ